MQTTDGRSDSAYCTFQAAQWLRITCRVHIILLLMILRWFKRICCECIWETIFAFLHAFFAHEDGLPCRSCKPAVFVVRKTGKNCRIWRSERGWFNKIQILILQLLIWRLRVFAILVIFERSKSILSFRYLQTTIQDASWTTCFGYLWLILRCPSGPFMPWSSFCKIQTSLNKVVLLDWGRCMTLGLTVLWWVIYWTKTVDNLFLHRTRIFSVRM